MSSSAARRRAPSSRPRRTDAPPPRRPKLDMRTEPRTLSPAQPAQQQPRRAPRDVLHADDGSGPSSSSSSSSSSLSLPRTIVAVGGTDAMWMRSPGLAADGLNARRSHWLRHAGVIEARGDRGERLVAALDDVWERDADALNAGDVFERELASWHELCTRRRARLMQTSAASERRRRGARDADARMEAMLLRLAELEDEEGYELNRRRAGRPAATVSVVAERSDILSITNEVRGCLRRMRRDRCALLQLHYAGETEDTRVLKRKVRDAALALADMAFGKGCADHVGMVNMSTELLQAILDEGVPIASAQFAMNVADTRALGGVMQLCIARGIVPIAHAPLLGGLLREESMLTKHSGKHDEWDDAKGVVRQLDRNSAPRGRGWSHIAKVSGNRGILWLQNVLWAMARVSRDMCAADGAMSPSVAQVALAWVMAKAEATYAETNPASSTLSGGGGGGDGGRRTDDDEVIVDGATGLCAVVGHGRFQDYFDGNRRATERLFLSVDAVAAIDAAAAKRFTALPGDVYAWERGLE